MLRRIHRAIRNLIDALGVPLGAAGLRAVNAVRGMQINGPAAEGDRVRVAALFDDVLLREDQIALEATALALAGDRADPFERQGLGFGKLAGVLDVIPDAVDDFPQLPLDLLAVVNGVERAAPFQPPEPAAVLAGLDVAPARNLGDVAQRERGAVNFTGRPVSLE